MVMCLIQPKPEMYGLGIRVAFYLQWLGGIWFNYVDQTVLPDLRLLGLCLSGSMTLAVLISSCDGSLEASESYVMIILATGGYMFLVPVYIWRLLTGCRRYWNPLHWSQEESLRVYRVFNFAIVFAGACVGIWFFAAYLPGLGDDCRQYGFMFGQVSMKSWAFIILNSMLHVAVVVVCAFILAKKWGSKRPREDQGHRRRRRRRREIYSHVRLLATLNLVSDCSVWVMLIMSVELAIVYNNISGTNKVNSATQLFALFSSIGACLRTHWLHVVEAAGRDDGDEVVQYYPWPVTYDEWWALANYQQAMHEARESERWSGYRRRQMRQMRQANGEW